MYEKNTDRFLIFTIDITGCIDTTVFSSKKSYGASMFINEVLYNIIEIYTFLYKLRKFSLKFDKFHPNSVEK
jgi:hypothetical protein